MKKLELKHLSPYLPYELEILILNYKSDYVGINRAEVIGHYFIGDTLYLTYKGGSTGKSQNEAKPILRPLSDLNKPIIIGGKEMVLTEQFEILGEVIHSGYDIKFLKWYIFSYLLSIHFDVFGLIESGLAIDINTLKQ